MHQVRFCRERKVFNMNEMHAESPFPMLLHNIKKQLL